MCYLSCCLRCLNEITQCIGVGCLHYTDNTQLYITLNKPLVTIVPILAQCLNAVVKCTRENKLKQKPDKMEVMPVRRATHLNWISLLMIEGVQLLLKNSVKSLGVLLTVVS